MLPELMSCVKVEVAVLGSPSLIVRAVPACGRKATLRKSEEGYVARARKLCESRGGRPGLPVPNSPCGPSMWT